MFSENSQSHSESENRSLLWKYESDKNDMSKKVIKKVAEIAEEIWKMYEKNKLYWINFRMNWWLWLYLKEMNV
jgi:hypothetical protein